MSFALSRRVQYDWRSQEIPTFLAAFSSYEEAQKHMWKLSDEFFHEKPHQGSALDRRGSKVTVTRDGIKYIWEIVTHSHL